MAAIIFVTRQTLCHIHPVHFTLNACQRVFSWIVGILGNKELGAQTIMFNLNNFPLSVSRPIFYCVYKRFIRVNLEYDAFAV